jgi:transcriptional regulator with XRE-family HTH domain
MQNEPRPSDLASAAGISISYASEILGDKRTPSRSLAIHIFRKTGWRHSLIAALADDEMELLERLSPFQPREAA